MEIQVPLPANDEVTPEEECTPITIRKLGRLETAYGSNPNGA